MSQTGQGPRVGRYELRGVLGRGGFAEVFRAWDPLLGREVALKAPGGDVRPAVAEGAGATARRAGRPARRYLRAGRAGLPALFRPAALRRRHGARAARPRLRAAAAPARRLPRPARARLRHGG